MTGANLKLRIAEGDDICIEGWDLKSLYDCDGDEAYVNV